MQDLKLAVLIDADNISPKYVKVILDEAASFGVAACKRIYGDWSDARLKSWKDVLLNNSIIPIQQYSYTTGKNSTDSAMIIDAMDILYSGTCDGFVLVSSDSDFTRLAIRLREAGKKVYGMGEKKTPNPFIVACDKFVYIEVIRAAAKQAAEAAKKKEEAQAKKTAKKENKKCQTSSSPAPEEIVELIAESEEAGVFAVKTEDSRQFFIMGHPEYDADTLAREYWRDVNKGLDIAVPAHYFPGDDPHQAPVVRWRSAGQLLYTNWLNYYVYQTTPYDLKQL